MPTGSRPDWCAPAWKTSKNRSCPAEGLLRRAWPARESAIALVESNITTRQVGRPSRQAATCLAAWALFLAVAAAGTAADLLTKHHVFSSLLNDPALQRRAAEVHAADYFRASPNQVLQTFQRRAVWRVRWTLSTNPGVVFGWSMPPWAVLIATFLTVTLVGIFFATTPAGAVVRHAALGCILAGAMGNLYDRLFSEVTIAGMEPIRRNVRDFIDCSQLYYPWIFNVADMLLVIGVACLAGHWLLLGRAGDAAD